MAEHIDDATARFLGGVMPVIVGTRRRNGTVKLNPAWYEFRDGHFWLNSWRGAHWLAHVERERQATLLFVDPQDMYRVVHVEAGLVRTATEAAGASALCIPCLSHSAATASSTSMFMPFAKSPSLFAMI